MTTISNSQADALTTIASLTDHLNGNSGIPLTDDRRPQVHAERKHLLTTIPAVLRGRAPWADGYRATTNWLRDQTITD